jgi:hypothetical protein
MMGSLEVVELHEPVKAAIERRPAGEVVPAKDHAPVLGENRLLQALDEAVGPGVARLDACMADSEGPTRGGELGFELAATVSEHALYRPAGLPDGGNDDRVQKVATAAAVSSGRIRATPYELATSHAVTCHTLPTPLSLPM